MTPTAPELPICEPHGRRMWDAPEGPWCPICEDDAPTAAEIVAACTHAVDTCPRVLTADDAMRAGIWQHDPTPTEIDPELEPA